MRKKRKEPLLIPIAKARGIRSGKLMITDKQQIMWDLAFEHGRAVKISSDGEYLADKMREKGLMLEDVGNACGVSKSCVGNWVQDLRPIPRKHKETIATTFGILL